MISVVLPVYNAEKFLAEAIESILEQTFTEFELIIINDGSTDGSDGIIQKYREVDSRIRYVKQENRGLIETLNLGLELAQYEIVARMDADDICTPDRFAIQFKFLAQHPNVVVVGGQLHLIDANGKFTRLGDYPITIEDVRKAARFGSPVAHPAVMYRKSAIVKSGQYRKAFKHAEDYDLWLRILECGDIANVSEVVLKYREHETNISKVHSEQQQLVTIAAQLSSKLRKMGIVDFPLDQDISISSILNIVGEREEFCEERLVLGLLELRNSKMKLSILQSKINRLRKMSIHHLESRKIFVSGIITLYKLSDGRFRKTILLGNVFCLAFGFPREFTTKIVSVLLRRLRFIFLH